jgi:hypothetical protein
MGKHFDHFLKYTPLTTYESFLTELNKGDELRNRYFYDSIKWGEKYRHDKNRRQLKYLNNRKAKQNKVQEKATTEPPKNLPPVATEPKVLTLYQGDPKRRGSTLSIEENVLLPKSSAVKPQTVINIIKSTYQ